VDGEASVESEKENDKRYEKQLKKDKEDSVW